MKRRPTTYVDASMLSISNDPLPARRQVTLKYATIFEKLKPGQCIKCEPGQAAKIAHALNTWLDRVGKPGLVRSSNRYEQDGKGRVWLLAPEKRLKAA